MTQPPPRHLARHLDRRSLLIAAAGLAAMAAPARAAPDPVEIGWRDLVPGDGRGVVMDRLREMGVVEHGQISTPWDQETGVAMTTRYDGVLVTLAGYTVPLDFAPEGVTEFLLVPYVGACIHVPPPPPNQLVMVSAERPLPLAGLFVPVAVTGTFRASATATGLAEIGYAIEAARVEPYRG